MTTSFIRNIMNLAYQLEYGTGISPHMVLGGIFGDQVC